MKPEDALQIACARYLDTALTQGWRWWHTPNGGSRRKGEAGKLRAMGVKPGVPDIIVAGPGRLIFIELKSATGRLSLEQREFKVWAEASGWAFYVCRNVDDVEIALDGAGVPLKARMATYRGQRSAA